MSNRIKDFLIGTDAELIVSRNGQIVSNGTICSNIHEEFGIDGNGGWQIGECRVEPSDNPLEIVRNIHSVFQRKIATRPNLLNYQWQAGSFKCSRPLGGHLHQSNSPRILDPKLGCTILNQYLAPILALIEDPEEGLDRKYHDKYGGYGIIDPYDWDSQYRLQPYGGWEYRIPFSFITSPFVAAGILCLFKTIIFEIINNSSFDFKNRLSAKVLNEIEVNRIKSQFPAIWTDIKKMKLYQVYKPYIDFLYWLIDNNLKAEPTCSFQEAWGLLNISPYTKNKVDLDMIWEKFRLENKIKEKIIKKDKEPILKKEDVIDFDWTKVPQYQNAIIWEDEALTHVGPV